VTDIKQRIRAVLDATTDREAGVLGGAVACCRDALVEIERLEIFRRNAVASAAAALDTRSNSRCVACLEEIFRNGSHL
jgi:hypothetical protein